MMQKQEEAKKKQQEEVALAEQKARESQEAMAKEKKEKEEKSAQASKQPTVAGPSVSGFGEADAQKLPVVTGLDGVKPRAMASGDGRVQPAFDSFTGPSGTGPLGKDFQSGETYHGWKYHVGWAHAGSSASFRSLQADFPGSFHFAGWLRGKETGGTPASETSGHSSQSEHRGSQACH
jgi:hypothetical protein